MSEHTITIHVNRTDEDPPRCEPEYSMTFASWFTGIGAADLAFELAGYTVAAQCEIDRHCNDVLEERWPNVPRHRDIATVAGDYADVYCGGWPCQDLSVAGKRAGLAGARSGLFHELVRVVAEGRPRWLLWENVPGLLSSAGGRDFGTVLGALADIGYFGAWRVLDSRYFGVAQRRRRVFGVFAEGHPGARRAAAVLLEPARGGWHPATRAGERPEVARALDCGAGGISGKEQQRTLVAGTCTHDTTAGRNTACSSNRVAVKCLSSRATCCDADTQTFVAGVPAPAICAGGQQPRKVVCPPPDATGAREAAGPAGWVDDLLPVGYDARRYKQTGNAMTVNVLYWIALRIRYVEAMLATEVTT